MNQILVNQKVYVTPELKRKKKIYKIKFFLSIFLVCLLSSYYIYAEYNRKKTEEVSKQITTKIMQDETIKSDEKDPIIIVLSEAESAEKIREEEEYKTNNKGAVIDGIAYYTESFITIPKIGISYPVLSETSDELLEVSVNKYWGPAPNELGNYCIVGHNYRNGKMFGRLKELEYGDLIELQDLTGRTVKYKVYNKYIVNPDDRSCTSQKGNDGDLLKFREMTLITCTNYGIQRLIIKCREV